MELLAARNLFKGSALVVVVVVNSSAARDDLGQRGRGYGGASP
jgi:hypothetical protein